MEFLKNFSPVKVMAIIAGGIAVMILLGFLTFKLATPPMSILYTNLTPDDSSLILSRLEGMGIPYHVADSGKDLLVPVNKVLMLRMTFAQEGIPRSGSLVGYEIFDKNETLGTSQFVHNVNLVRALEGELSRTIGSLTPIENARVHLVMPKKELFSKSGSEPTASVVLRMRGSQSLSKQEVAAISHLVATAVPGLKVENVTIVDNRGKPLKLGASEEGNASAITDTAADYQHNIEERYKGILEDLLEKSVGVGKIKANVTAEINFDREVVNSEVYDPEGQVVRSKKTSEETDSESESSGSETSVTTNLPGSGAGAGGANGKNKSTTNEVTNYEISKTITNKISESGRIKQLSIAILVDGLYDVKPKEEGSEEMVVNYSPRSEEELNKIKTLASSAVGIDPKRGDKLEVINMRFSDEFATLPQKEKPLAWLQSELENIVQTVVIGTVIILLILLVVRPVILRSLEMRKMAKNDDQDLQEVIAHMNQENLATNAASGTKQRQEEELIDLSMPEDKRKVNLIKQVNELVEKHPEETVSILRNWLYSSDQ
jgi:flagellar M-ring protein FliF